ncbi:hypothetical protein SteCoe_10720 [Stentor coeruleus]|uniref:Uncharacterized protein n=1 Tax=Stentor coeruleus TaxID=5963 RepID=A0A1R2CF10_9CILI|nr:hypothetical protein SteCoe_10720 [Stentor coeruleus]
MDHTEDSDNEFWEDMNSSHILRSSEVANRLMNVRKSKANIIPSKSPLLEKNILEKDYYQDKISRIRESKDVEVKQHVIITKNYIKKEYNAKFFDAKEKYKEDLFEIKRQCANLTESLQDKDIFMNFLCQIIADIGIYITNARISKTKTKNITKNEPKTFNEEHYVQQIQILINQIEFLKDTCSIYKGEIDKVKAKVYQAKENCKNIEKNLKEEIEKLNGVIKQKEIDYEVKIKQFHLDFEKYKKEITFEHQVKDEIVERQKVYIESLQDELKNAKMVLQNRRLRMKFYEKLDDYVKDHEQTTSPKNNKSVAISRNTSSKIRSRDQSRSVCSRKRISEVITHQNGIFALKLGFPDFSNGDKPSFSGYPQF